MLPNIWRDPAGRTTAIAAGVVACLTGVPAAAGDFRQDLAAAYNETGQQLFGALRDKPGNIVLSPYSVGSAMAMVLVGARGDTEREMVSVLRLRQPAADVPDANAAIMAILNGYDRSEVWPTCADRMSFSDGVCVAAPASGGQCPPRSMRDRAGRCVATPIWPQSARLRTANALMLGRSTGLVGQNYVALLKDKFGAEVFRNAGLAEVNGWVDRRTEGMIRRLLDRFDPDTPAVILNAVYFKAAWRTPFSRDATAPAEFHLSAVRKAQVPTMRLHASFALYAGSGFRAIRLPYTIPELSMTVVLPGEIDGLPAVAQRLGAKELADLFAALRARNERPVVVAMPRFRTGFRAGLGEIFQRLGMKKAFMLDQADFSAMTSRAPAQARVAIQDVIHQAVIDVTEAGTEAAAATAIVMAGATLQPKLEEFTVDRPFLFFVTDDVTGAILFQGRVVDPRG